MNRVGLGLAVGAGYVLGRTKKMKLAFAVGTLVAGKRMQLSPKAIAELVNQQLLRNPQLKEIGDEVRQDLRGVGKAASGALVERQMSALADRLHGRTEQVRDQVAGIAPDVPGLGQDDESEDAEDAEEPEEAYEGEEADEAEEEPEARDDEEAAEASEDEEDEEEPPARKTAAPAKKAAKKAAPGKKKAAPAKKTAPAKKAAKKTPAKKQAAGQSAARRTSEGRRR